MTTINNIENMEEIWKTIDGYEGLYEVSNLGRIKSLERTKRIKGGGKQRVPEKIRALSYGSENNRASKYAYIVLSNNGKNKTYLVHRLVAKAFLPNPNNLPIVNHKDENPKNDCVDNLEWCDYTYNNTYRDIHLRRDLSNVSRAIIQYDLDMHEIKRWQSAADIEKETSIKQANIIKCCKGDRAHCGGFKWRYYE